MKKIISLILVCVMLCAVFVGCTNNDSENTNQPTHGGSNPSTNQESKPTEGTSVPSGDKYDNYAKISGKKVYVNYRSGRRTENKSSSVTFYSNATDMTVLTYNAESFSGTAEEAFALLNDGRMLRNIAFYADADFLDYETVYKIETKTTESVTINNIETQKFIGTVKSSDNRNCYIYGYAFVISDTPCILAGLVFTEEQEQNLINTINIEVDTMMQTVRTER